MHSELGDALPVHYSIGYYEGRHHSKKWLTTDQDLTVMYQKIPCGDLSMWCDPQEVSDDVDDIHARDRSPVRPSKCGKREEKDTAMDDIFEDLKSRHGNNYSGPQLRLWARMISNGVYTDKDDPPRVPMITGTPSRPKKELLTEALTGAATAIANVFKTSPNRPTNSTTVVGISPCKAAELRMKNLEQLQYIQQLMEDHILSENEYAEQKEIILNTLRKMA